MTQSLRTESLSSSHLTLILFFFNMMQDFQLDALAVYIRVGQRLVRQHQYSSVRQLLKCVGESGTASKHDCDAIVLSCVSVADKSPGDVSSQTNYLFLDLPILHTDTHTHTHLWVEHWLLSDSLSRKKNKI